MPHPQEDKISDTIIEPGQFLAIHIGDSKSTKTISGDSIRTKNSEFWFFQVADVANLNEKPVRLFDSTGNTRGPIAANSGIDYSQLFDADGNDTLRNDEMDWRIYHFSIGVQQSNIRIYPRIPENQNGGAFTYLTGDEPDPLSPDPFGYVRSDDTDVFDPSPALESIAWRAGQRSVHQYGFYNENDVQVDPIISIVGAAYELRPVTERDAMLNLLADIGKPVDEHDNRVRVVDLSRHNVRTFSFDVPEEWKDAQNNLTVERANLPEEIEKSLEGGEGGDN